MFHYISGLSAYDPVTPRRVSDYQPFIVPAPRWTRLGRLATAVGALATLGRRQARTTSPAPVSGSPTCG